MGRFVGRAGCSGVNGEPRYFQVICDLGALANGASATVTIQIGVNSSMTGTIANTATVSADTTDPDESNNTATAETTVR